MPEQQVGSLYPMTTGKDADLVGYVMSKVLTMREARDLMRPRWNEYYRLWRGFWSTEDKQRQSERSRTIMPALANAVEMTVAEMQEATFGNGDRWFEIDDDMMDQDPKDAEACRGLLDEDFKIANVRDAIVACYTNSALYGTGIAKIITEAQGDGTILNYLEAVNPNEFLIDPAARTIDEAHCVVHELRRPFASVMEKQSRGVYRPVHITPFAPSMTLHSDGQSRKDFEADRYEDVDTVLITEYHGLVPKKFLEAPTEENPASAFQDEVLIDPSDGEELVEAIVTLGNEGVVLRAEYNPVYLQDRGFIAFQHESVPGRFWGRGVAEKGYNPQKALDAEHRMRQDALAYVAAPMFLYNIAALGGKRFQLNPRPGRQIPVADSTIDLNNVVGRVNTGDITPSTFQQTNELERMVHLGTGAMDVSGFSRDVAASETATGASVSKSVFVKRSKLTMDNVERNFLQPLIKKMLLRYIQFDNRYPKEDVKFVIRGSLGMVAREMEQAGLIQMVGLVPQGSLTQRELIRGYVDSSSHPNKSRILAALEQDSQPDPQAQQLQQQQMQLQMERAALENQKLKMELQETQGDMKKTFAEIQKIMAEIRDIVVKTGLEDERVAIEQRRTMQEERRLDQEDERLAVEKQRINSDTTRSY